VGRKTVTYSPLVAVQSIAVSVSVHLSLHSHISKTTCPDFMKFSLHVTRGYGSVLRWRQCNIVLCSSGFVDDVMFANNGLCVACMSGPIWIQKLIANTSSMNAAVVTHTEDR